MQKITSQILYNLKKDKGAYLSFGMVIVFTAIMLNLALVLVFQVDRAYDSKFEELNTATLNICIPKIQDADTLTDEIKALTGVSEIEKRDAVFLEAVVKDFRGADFTMNTMFYNKDASRRKNVLSHRGNPFIFRCMLRVSDNFNREMTLHMKSEIKSIRLWQQESWKKCNMETTDRDEWGLIFRSVFMKNLRICIRNTW